MKASPLTALMVILSTLAWLALAALAAGGIAAFLARPGVGLLLTALVLVPLVARMDSEEARQ